MTTSPHERAQRLPRDLALIALAIKVGIAVIGIGAQLIWAPYAEGMRKVYTMAESLVPILSTMTLNWAFATLVVWCFARHALDRYGPAGLARPGSARVIFGVVFLLLVCLLGYVLTPLFQMAAVSYIHSTAATISTASFVFALNAVWQLALLALFAWFACWLALRPGPGAAPVPAASSSSSPSPRRAIAWIVGVFFVCLQMLMSSLFQVMASVPRDMGLGPLLVGWIVAPLVIAALALWGAWMGARESSQVRPLRAIAASALSFVLLQLICIGLVIAWVLLVLRPGYLNDTAGSVVGLAILYVFLTVVLTRSVVRGLYRRFQAVPAQ